MMESSKKNEIDGLQNHEIEEVYRQIKEIRDILKPIAETYTTATTMGKWFMGLLVFISVSIGVILGIKNLWKI